MNELYHAKRSHKYVAKVKGAGKGGRPLYFYSMAAYRSFINGVKDKTGLAAKEQRDKYRQLAEENTATYRLNRNLNAKAKTEMSKASALNSFHSARAATSRAAVETHTQGMKAVTKMANARTNGKGSMNGREAGEFARQHIKATSAARSMKAHEQGRKDAVAKYKAASQWKDTTKERADNAYNKAIVAQRRAHQAQKAYEKTLPGKIEKKAREVSELPSKWGQNAKSGLEAARRTVVGDKRDKYASWKLNKTAANTSNKQLSEAYTAKAAKLKARYDGSVTGIVDNTATKIRHAFDKAAGSKRTLSTVKSPSAKIVRQAQAAVARSANTKVKTGDFSSVVESIKQAVGYNEYAAFKSASQKRAVAENKYKNQQGQYRAWKDFHEGGKAGKYPNTLAERRGRQNLNNEKRWTRAKGAELREAKATENAAKEAYSSTLMGRVDNLFGGIKGASRPQAVKTKYNVKRNEAHELAGRLRRKGQPAKTEDSKTLADGTAFRSRKKRVTANNGQGVKKRARVNSQYLDPVNGKGVPPKTLISLYKSGKITKQQALDYIDPSKSGNSYDMGTQWRLEQIIKTGEDPYDKAVKYAAARQANAKKKAKRRGEDAK